MSILEQIKITSLRFPTEYTSGLTYTQILSGDQIEEFITENRTIKNFSFNIGDIFDITIIYKGATSNPVNLTGYEIQFISELPMQVEILDAKAGRIRLYNNNTESLIAKSYDYSLIIKSQEKTEVILDGVFVVQNSIVSV